MLKTKPAESFEDTLEEDIMHPGKNQIVDKLLSYL
jgi:hypothetical protein